MAQVLFGENRGSLPKPVLHQFEHLEHTLSKRKWCLIDQSGAVTKRGAIPPNYAPPSGFPYPPLGEIAFNYAQPVDSNRFQDFEYIYDQFNERSEQKLYDLQYGEVDKTGRITLNPEFTYLGPTSDHRVLFEKAGGKFGFLDDNDTIVIPPEYEDGRKFSEGLAAVKKNEKWGFIDTSGSTVIPFIYESVREFSEGLAAR